MNTVLLRIKINVEYIICIILKERPDYYFWERAIIDDNFFTIPGFWGEGCGIVTELPGDISRPFYFKSRSSISVTCIDILQ